MNGITDATIDKRLVTVILLVVLLVLSGCSFSDFAPGGYAIVYGISLYDPDYDEGDARAWNLTYANDDAVAVAAMFEEAGYTVLLRTDSEATKDNLIADIDYVSHHIGAEENFIFYFSGHGAQSSVLGIPASGSEPAGRDRYDEWIFLFGSLKKGSPPNIDAALSDDELLAFINNLPTARRIVILDACNSGGFIGCQVDVDLIAQDSSGGEAVRFLDAAGNYFSFSVSDTADVPASKAMVITASGEQEEAYESTFLKHGVFTYYLLESRYEADANGDGFVTLGEWFDYASLMIETWWKPSMFVPRISGGPVDLVLFESAAP